MTRAWNQGIGQCIVVVVLFSLLGITCVGEKKKISAGPKGDKTTSGEKLLLGFEKAELGRGAWIANQVKPGWSWFYLIERQEGIDFSARFEVPDATNRAYTWRCRPGEHTEGNLALTATVGPANPKKLKPTFRQTAYLSYFYPALRNRFEAWEIMRTYTWLVKSRPDLRDWSGYDLLRVDMRSEKERVKIWLAMEDEILEPPVMRIFRVPSGRWVTLEVDLVKAVKARELDLKKMVNFWLLGCADSQTGIRVDNVRLAKRDTVARYEVLRDESSMKLPPLNLPDRPVVPELPAGIKPDRSPIKLGNPISIEGGSLVPFGWVSAYDNKRLFLAYTRRKWVKGTLRRAAHTLDGGNTWIDLREPVSRNLDHGTARGSVVDERGDGIAISSGPGCARIGRATPRQHCTKYTFAGNGWKARSGNSWKTSLPADILDCDIRHCGSNASIIRLRNGPHKGRLWASWGETGRMHAYSIHVKFSDDDGKTWHPWGKGALLPDAWGPNKHGVRWDDRTYHYPQTRITPYGDHVACFWQMRRHRVPDGIRIGLYWSRFDGSKWSKPEQVDPLGWAGEGSGYRAPGSAVTTDNGEIYVTALHMPGVVRWDGRTWKREASEAPSGGCLTVCGGKDVLLFTAGKDVPGWFGSRYVKAGVRIQCFRRQPDGTWKGPEDISGEIMLHMYRGMPGLVVPQYSPPNFAPVAWSEQKDKKWVVKVLKVPVSNQ